MGQSEKMEQEDNRPKWLLELENRKRKPRLAHEVGAGAPCMTCSTACPGLDLHFWRKICKNCKCSRDDHDVPNDEFPQFNLLFGPSGKPNRKMIVLKVNKKQTEDEMTFEWAPPDTTRELAADYMKALPEDKLPIKGSSGAALRKQQLQRQLPLHDIDHKVCDELSESERKQFEKYLENLKKYVGQGKVMKAMGARPFDLSLMTPANATDMNRYSPRHKQNQSETVHSLNLRTPSSFVKKSTYPSGCPRNVSSESANDLENRNIDSYARDQSPISSARMETVRSPAFGNTTIENSPQGRYHRALANIRNDGETTRSSPVDGTRNPPIIFSRKSRISDDTANSLSMMSDNENIDNNRLSENSSGTRNASKIDCQDIGGAGYGTALEFATSNILAANDDGHGASSFLENNVNPLKTAENNDGGLNYATSGTMINHKIACSSPANLKLSSSILSNDSASNSGLYDDEQNDPATMARLIHERENSLLAERMLNEALLPPSSINAPDIIGSTLDERGLSFIREKLTSKYSRTKDNDDDESMNPRGSSRSRDLTSVNLRKEDNGARSKRADQLRRQVAFDRETDKNDVIGIMKNPSDMAIMNEIANDNYCPEDASLNLDELRQRANYIGEIGNNDKSIDSRENKMSDAARTFKQDEQQQQQPCNEPWRRVIRGICDDYLAKPGQTISEIDIHEDNNDRRIGSSFNNNSRVDPATCCESLRAELANYGPGNSNIVRSEDLHNPVFPEHARISKGALQNPVSVDRIRGAIEELSVADRTIAQNCHQCRESIRAGDVVVSAEKANDAYWHPGCFVCSVCNELLADLVYFYYKGKLYCGRDLATLLEIPRCFACDELIFVREYTVAEGHNYHVKHFCCWDCDVPLAGQQYISENDRPLCLPCYQITYAKTCRTCNGLIAADQQGVAVKNLNFHANDECFCCATCNKSLLNGKMAIKEDRPFCSKECIAKFLNERIN